jgi:glycosyltransferase involved in cell wall biosynthesis
MVNQPTVSVIVPVYNCEKYLARCLDSIRAQTYKNLDVVMVDDGSSDSSAQICHSYEDADSRFRYFHKENGGVSSARNLGLDNARGEFIGFVDGDDEILPDMIQLLLENLLESGADASVISPIVAMGESRLAYRDNPEPVIFSGSEAAAQALRGVIFAGHLCTKLFKARLFRTLRLRTDLAICEDLVAVYDAFLMCKTVVFSDAHKYVYYTNPTSAINSEFKDSFLTYITATEHLLSRAKAELPEAANYAAAAVINAHLDVLSKLYYAKRLTGAEYKKYRARIREVATRDALRLMPAYRRMLAGGAKGPRWCYVVSLKCFNALKKIAYLFMKK